MTRVQGTPATDEDRELLILDQHPYDADPDLSWTAPHLPSLPYDGEIPEEVLLIAQLRTR